MSYINDPLWINIRDFKFDKEDDELTYAIKLAFENDWDFNFTQKVINEYKKFLYLCASTNDPHSPSPFVDKAWHLHLSYTKSYWEDMCKGIIGRLLHHEPSRGKEGENEYHDRMYLETLALYEKVYGENPPADIWPPSMEYYRKSKKFSIKKLLFDPDNIQFSVLKILCFIVLIMIIGLLCYLIINRPETEIAFQEDKIAKTTTTSESYDLMEIIEKHPKKILIGILVGSFLVFYLFFKGFSQGGGGGIGRGGGYGGCAASCAAGCGGGCGGG